MLGLCFGVASAKRPRRVYYTHDMAAFDDHSRQPVYSVTEKQWVRDTFNILVVTFCSFRTCNSKSHVLFICFVDGISYFGFFPTVCAASSRSENQVNVHRIQVGGTDSDDARDTVNMVGCSLAPGIVVCVDCYFRECFARVVSHRMVYYVGFC